VALKFAVLFSASHRRSWLAFRFSEYLTYFGVLNVTPGAARAGEIAFELL